MTSLIALTIFLSLSLAVPQLIRPCTCPLPICPLEFIAKCRCENAAALACWEQYSTQGIVCASPTPAPCGGAITRDVTACVCEPKGCLQIWPESCYCANAIKKECFDKCGGVELVYQVSHFSMVYILQTAFCWWTVPSRAHLWVQERCQKWPLILSQTEPRLPSLRQQRTSLAVA